MAVNSIGCWQCYSVALGVGMASQLHSLHAGNGSQCHCVVAGIHASHISPDRKGLGEVVRKLQLCQPVNCTLKQLAIPPNTAIL